MNREIESYFVGLVFLNIIDLLLTYYLIAYKGAYELNYLYHLGGWGLIILFKLFFVGLCFYLGFRDFRVLIVGFWIYGFVVFWNLYVLFGTIGQ